MSKEREAEFEAWAKTKRFNVQGKHDAWLGWQAARQSAGASETTLRVLPSHAIRRHEGVTIFGDPAHVLKVMAAIEGAMEQIKRYQKICGAAYQLAGLVGAPLRFLDALSNAANGEPMENGVDLLPVTIDECTSFDSKAAKSKWVKLTDDEVRALRNSICTLRGRGLDDSANIVEALLARAQAKGE